MGTTQLLSHEHQGQSPIPGGNGFGIPTFAITEADSHKLARQLEELDASPYEDFDDYLLKLYSTARALPLPLLQAVRQFRCPTSYGAMLLKHLPLDHTLPPTPPDGKRPQNKASYISEGSAVLIAQLLGEIFSYQGEKAGEYLQTVAPVQRNATAISNEGSRVDLLLHTEDVHLHPLNPDYVCLFCIRADRHREAVTLVVDLRDALARLNPDIIATLRQPCYVVPPPESFGGGGTASAPMPILRGPATMPEVTVEFNVMTATNPEAEVAFSALKAACYSPEVLRQVSAEPGDLLLLDNRKCIHGRNIFRPAFDGYDRWLLRVFVKESFFWPTRGFCSSSPRVLAF
jgi:L-asparagine oxygenase